VDSTTARPTPNVPIKALSRTAPADLEASRTSHERSALTAKLSACRKASRHLLSFNSTAVRCAATGRHTPVARTMSVRNSTRPNSARGLSVERIRADAFVPTRAARVEVRTDRSSRRACRTCTRNGDVTGQIPLASRVRNASVSNRTATMSAMPCAAGISPTTRCAPPRGISRWTWPATSAVISASQRNPPLSRSLAIAFGENDGTCVAGPSSAPTAGLVIPRSIEVLRFAASVRGFWRTIPSRVVALSAQLP
jgi:hypothetical protein